MVLLQGYVGMPSSPLRCSLEFIFSCVSLSIIKGCKFRQMAFCLDACQTARLSQTMGAPPLFGPPLPHPSPPSPWGLLVSFPSHQLAELTQLEFCYFKMLR